MHKNGRKTLVRCTKVKKQGNNSHSPLAILLKIIYDIGTLWGSMAKGLSVLCMKKIVR